MKVVAVKNRDSDTFMKRNETWFFYLWMIQAM